MKEPTGNVTFLEAIGLLVFIMILAIPGIYFVMKLDEWWMQRKMDTEHCRVQRITTMDDCMKRKGYW